MKAGKLSEAVLKRSVLRKLNTVSALGTDYASFPVGEGDTVVSATETRCLGRSLPGFAAMAGVQAAVNNLVCSGGTARGIMIDLLLPTSASENDLREEVAAIERVCNELDITVLGGHTEVVRMVSAPLITVTAIGTVRESQLIANNGAKPGMDIIMTKGAALEGTALLALEREGELRSRYSQPFIDQAKRFAEMLSVVPEAAVAAKSGAAAMHDLSEGGVFGALWELGQCSGIGLDIDLKKIPIRQETVEICEFFDINPYKLLSGGSLLIAADDGGAVVRALEETGISAALIGRATDGNDRIFRNGDEIRYMETTQTDELWKLEKEK